jgi:tetratricopeptide (TPR) repeat protein
MLSGRFPEGKELAERGLALTEALDVPALRSHLLNSLGVCRVSLADAAGVELIRQALDLALETSDPEAIGRGYINLCDTLGRVGRFRESVDVAEAGRVALRKLGAPAMEWFVAGNEASALLWLGRYQEAEELIRQILDDERAIMGVPGLVNAHIIKVMLLHRRGEHLEARVAADEMLPLARRIGGSEYLGPALLGEAELELARGNEAAARQALLEAVDIAAEEDVAHVLPLIPTAARLLPKKDVEALLERVSALSPLPLNEAQRTEATARITGDADRFREAASLYAAVEAPYEEAQCLAAAGDVDAAVAIFERLGVPKPAIV